MTDTPIITTLEEPRIDQYREMRVKWSDHLGNSSHSLDIETYLTAEELMQLVDKLRGDA